MAKSKSQPKRRVVKPSDPVRIEYVSIDAVVEAGRNPKNHEIEKICESMRRFGFVMPIAEDASTGRLVAGHGRLEALRTMRDAGEDPPARVKVGDTGWMIPVVRGVAFMDEAEAEAYLIADNRLSEIGGWDDVALAEILKAMPEAPRIVSGFSTAEVDALIAKVSGPPQLDNKIDESPIFPDAEIVDQAFAHFRKSGFPYRDLTVHEQMQELNALSKLDQATALNSTLGYQVADTYQPHRFAGHATGMRSPLECFGNDKCLRAALEKHQKYSGSLSHSWMSKIGLANGTQACSNFRPGFAMHLYRRFGKPGGVILDPSAGYGGRLIGWIASRLGGRYVGVDPSTKTYEGNCQIAQTLARSGNVHMICSPFEDVDIEAEELTGIVDLVFTSPPYFGKELYTDESTQSFSRYPTFEKWKTGFLSKMMLQIERSLSSTGRAIVNIADVNIRGKSYPLEQALLDCAIEARLVLVETCRFAMSVRFGSTSDEIASEPVFVFKRILA